MNRTPLFHEAEVTLKWGEVIALMHDQLTDAERTRLALRLDVIRRDFILKTFEPLAGKRVGVTLIDGTEYDGILRRTPSASSWRIESSDPCANCGWGGTSVRVAAADVFAVTDL